MSPLKRNSRRTSALGPAAAAPISRFRNEFDQLLSRFFNDDPWYALDFYPEAAFNWTPAIDISETDDSMMVRAELPGMDAKNIDVRVRDNRLTISGEKSEETIDDQRKDSWYCERTFGAFSRTFDLPANVDAGKINAEYANGVLTLKLPRPAAVAARQIEVKPVAKTVAPSPSIPATSSASATPAPAQRVPVGAGR